MMPLDDRLRTELRRIANEVDPDIEGGLQRARSARPPSAVRRAGTLLAYVAAAGLAAAVIRLGASSLLDRSGTGPSPTPSAEVSAAPSSASAQPCPNPNGGECRGRLEPGFVYRSTQFIPPVTYFIPKDTPVAWDNPEDKPGTLTLHPAGPDSDAIFFFRDVRVLTTGCDPQLDDAIGNTAADIATWMSTNPNLTVTPPETVQLGGLAGLQLDLRASGTYTTACPNDNPGPYPTELPLVPLFGGAGSGDLMWYAGGNERMRLYLLDMPGGGNLVISIDAIGSDFETLLETTLMVLNSVSFDEKYY